MRQPGRVGLFLAVPIRRPMSTIECWANNPQFLLKILSETFAIVEFHDNGGFQSLRAKGD